MTFFSALLKGGPTMARALSSFVLAGALASVEAWKKKKAPHPHTRTQRKRRKQQEHRNRT